MTDGELHVVTGAFSYTGKYITTRLLDAGVRVRTLTGHPERPSPYGEGRIEVAPYAFDDMAALTESLRGATTLYNTYWVRFSRGENTFERAAANTKALIAAAEAAGLRRIVHVSIANPSLESPLPYYRGKAQIEHMIADSPLSHAILRPTVLFGDEDVLINNIAWLLRRFPIFPVPGDGSYSMQPMFVDDMAALAVEQGRLNEKVVIDAVGPETFTFNEILYLIADAVGSDARIIHAPPRIALAMSRVIGLIVRDVVLTPDEVAGLTAGLLVTTSPPAGTTRLTDWLRSHSDSVGRRYASELAMHFR